MNTDNVTTFEEFDRKRVEKMLRGKTVSYDGMDITWWYEGKKINWNDFCMLACSGSLDEPA